MAEGKGLEKGLTNYGDRGFRRLSAALVRQSMGYSGEMLGAADRRHRRHRPAASTTATGDCPSCVEAVKRGVLAAGGLPLEFPTISLGEVFLSPTSMMFRNLMSMDVEEMIRAQPMDAVVLVGGCDKTVPAQLMGAVSAGVPAIQLVAGPMMTGRYHGERLGACTDCRRFWATLPRRRRRAARDRRGRGQPRGHRRHLRRDGHGQHDGLHRRGARA